MTKQLTKKTVELKKIRIPMKKLLHGKEIRDAAAALESFRLGLNEQEFLYGAKIYLHVGDYGETHAVAKRLETDKEFTDRIEKARLAKEAKAERERLRAIKEAKRREQEELTKKVRVAEYIRKMAEDAGLRVDILE